MGHKFESGFVVRDAAWHGLATVLKDAPTVEAGIKQAGLDWDVLTCPIEVVIPGGRDTTKRVKKTRRTKAPGWRATVRESDGAVLGVVSDKYKTIQNRECFEFFQKFLDDKSCQLESAGSLRNGKNVWVLAKILDKAADIVPGDTVEPYLLLATAHDGLGSNVTSLTEVRVVCWNTQEIAVNQAERAADSKTGKAARITHMGDVKTKLRAVRDQIDIAARRIGEVVEQARVMRRVDMGAGEYLKFLESVYKPERDLLREELDKVKIFLKEDGHSVKALAQAGVRMLILEEKIGKPFRRESTIKTLIHLFEEGPGADMAGKTLWGAVSAVTHYEEHLRAGGNEKRLFSSWFGGTTEKIRQRAYDVAAQVVT